MTAVRSPLVSAAELAPVAAAVTLLDVRWTLSGGTSPEDFEAGHLPGAAFADLEEDLCAPTRGDGAGGRHPLPAAAAFSAAMSRLGVRADRPVVVYDGGPGMSAARAWWLLRFFGHPDVQLLDGGLAAWVAAGLPVETGGHVATSGAFTAVPGRMPIVNPDDLLDPPPGLVLLDAREAIRYRGEAEPVDKVAGHIPGALSAPTSANVTADDRFAPASALRERYRELGADAAATLAVYCGSGITAAHEVLALHSAGLPAALYPGSWSDWISDPGRPVSQGAKP